MTTLAIDSVTHRFGAVTAVADASLDVGAGEIVCLVGPSGCGKTTLLRVAAGLEVLQEGRVRLDNMVVAEPGRALAPEARGVGMVFQDYALFPHLSVAENVAFGLTELRPDERRRVARDALALVELDGLGEVYPHQLSGGQQQRVALARALAPKPRVMLLDEPFSGLDTQMLQLVRHEALHILRDTAIATLMVTHDPEEAMYMADRIAVMRDGQLIQVGTPDELYMAPVDAFVAAFIGEVNFLTGTVIAGKVATVLGDVDAAGIADGTAVDVLVRPEALGLSNGGEAFNDDGCAGEVAYSRFLGRNSLIDVAVGDGSLRLHARVPGRMLPAAGTRLNVRRISDDVFVFPCPPT